MPGRAFPRANHLPFSRSMRLAALCAMWGGTAIAVEPVDFNRDIRPLLSDKCFQCHGPDAGQRQAELRLDRQADAFATRERTSLIVPKHPERSELYRRISTADAELRMPPADADGSLSREQIELIRRWIDEGATWDEHWAFVAPSRPDPPTLDASTASAADVENAIDPFVRFRLQEEGLHASPPGDRETLIRRVTLDLTGLPPTLAEIDAFLADGAPNAYERLVDRLLASPRYGERMAVPWLDAARYADTSGYQNDGPREMWRWRDWVIDAFNANMPFDQFTTEQLAGDLFPLPSLLQWIATGFNRNHRGNAEGGIIPEEYAVEYVVDRVETTATVWLGLTLGCARCHDHKYDPFSQKDFYRLYAFFNNVPESGRAIKEGNSPPYILAPTASQRQELARLDAQVRAAQRAYERLWTQSESRFDRWQQTYRPEAPVDWKPQAGLHAYLSFDGLQDSRTGRVGNAAHFDGEDSIDAGNVGDFGYFDPFTLSAWVNPNDGSAGTIVSRMTNEPEGKGDGYRLFLRDGRIHVDLVKRWLDDALRVATAEVLRPHEWQHISVVYDGTRRSTGVTIFVDGQPVPHAAELDGLNQTFYTDEPFRIGGGGGPSDRFRGMIDEVCVFDRAVTPAEVELLAVGERIDEILAIPQGERTPAQTRKLQRYYVERHAAAELKAAQRRHETAPRARARFLETVSTVMVMHERPEVRPTHVLLRGAYDQPGERVERGLPELLGPFSPEMPRDRRGLAQWLLSENNPLTARVAVNRAWKHFFGIGLVKTSEDFGVQGERPSHPDLLDWLANELRRTGWDIKALHRLIVTSATYRQASHVSPELAQRDPENRLLARGPRYRLSAEMIRDAALCAGSLLVEEIGGPSVKPYQPPGLWEEIATSGPYEQDTGRALYRRGIYTYWKRTVSPPTMVAFDASTRETCVVQRSRTNTPLQALALMNDVTYVEAARALAQRTLTTFGADTNARLTGAFRLVTSRFPTHEELQILERGLAEHLRHFREHPGEAEKLLCAGESPVDRTLDAVELAAYMVVANLLLNLDEALNQE